MHMPWIPTLLGLDLSGVLVIAMILFSVIGWVISAVKKAREAAEQTRLKREAAHLQERASMHISGARQDAQASATPAVNPQQEAAARRAQALAQMRTQAARTGSTQPDNLSIAQREARDRAREAYQRRQELLARQREALQQQQQAASPRPAQASASQQTPARPTAAQSASARASQQQAQARQAQQQAQARQAQAAAARSRSAQAAQPRRILSEPGVSAPMQVESLSDRRTDREPLQSGSSRREADLAARSDLSPGAAMLRGSLTGQSLRSAFLLKEVLDRPLALRDPAAQAGENWVH